jgi:hypothetical protein
MHYFWSFKYKPIFLIYAPTEHNRHVSIEENRIGVSSFKIIIAHSNRTGANDGIGYEIVKQLLKNGNYFVYLGSRSADKGKAAA